MKRMIDPQNTVLEDVTINGKLQDTNGNDYQPFEDVSNLIENTADFDVVFLKAYKIGKMVFINLQVENEGDQISGNTTILQLDEKLYPVGNIVGYARIGDSNSVVVIVPTGEISVINNIPTNGVLSLIISYPIE